MSHVPHAPAARSEYELEYWLDCERDAAYTAKLAILRLEGLDDIAQLGVWLREHERHADELHALGGARGSAPRDPAFVTRDAHVIGALGNDVLAALARLEVMRVERYEARARTQSQLDGVLERHLRAARARRAWLRARSGAGLRRGEPLRILNTAASTIGR